MSTFILDGCMSKGVLVVVDNQSGGMISNLKLEYTGGNIGTNNLDNKQVFECHINPQSESGLKLQFINTSGKVFRKTIDVYFERNYRGNILVTIHATRILVKDNIKIPSLLGVFLF